MKSNIYYNPENSAEYVIGQTSSFTIPEAIERSQLSIPDNWIKLETEGTLLIRGLKNNKRITIQDSHIIYEEDRERAQSAAKRNIIALEKQKRQIEETISILDQKNIDSSEEEEKLLHLQEEIRQVENTLSIKSKQK